MAMTRLGQRAAVIAGAMGLCLGAASVPSCGFDDPDAAYYAGDSTATTLIEPDTLKAWLDAGGRTEAGNRVVVLDCIPNPSGIFPYSDMESWYAGNAERVKVNMAAQYGPMSPQYKMIDGLASKGMLGHIPGAIPNMAHEGYEVTPRSDGPMIADHEVGTGSLISDLLCRLGIAKDDVVVLTTSRLDYPGFCPARFYWTLRYWGFSRDHVKILNGGNKGWVMAGNSLEKGVKTLVNVTPSNFDLGTLSKRFFHQRISLGELMEVIDSGRTALPDDDPNKVIVVDTRQPPAAYYYVDADGNDVPDVFEQADYPYDPQTKTFDVAATPDVVEKLTAGQVLFGADYLAIPFSSTSNPPINPADSHGLLGILKAGGGPLAIPLGAKPAAFEGVMHGAKMVKTSTYNITIPALTRTDGGYKTKDELLPLFAKAGIDGTKPIITYCNSGALAAIYYYVFKEVCGFSDVRLYDGSWAEWANLVAYEPADASRVKFDAYTVYPMYPKGSPKITVFAGPNANFQWSEDKQGFVDTASGKPVGEGTIRPGGPLSGLPVWDSVHRSDRVIFRATSTTAAPYKSYKAGVNWPTVETTPDYVGPGHEIQDEDEQFIENTPAPTGDGGGPSAFVPVGGGC